MKFAQVEWFGQELLDVSRSNAMKPNSRLIALNPILVDGVLRVGGRLRHAPISFKKRHPMILPNKHPITDHYFWKLLHAEPQLLAAVVRERF